GIEHSSLTRRLSTHAKPFGCPDRLHPAFAQSCTFKLKLRSGRMVDHAPDELADFRREGLPLRQPEKLLAQVEPLQRLAPLGVQRAALRVVPRRRAAVAEHLARLVPRPQ